MGIGKRGGEPAAERPWWRDRYGTDMGTPRQEVAIVYPDARPGMPRVDFDRSEQNNSVAPAGPWEVPLGCLYTEVRGVGKVPFLRFDRPDGLTYITSKPTTNVGGKPISYDDPCYDLACRMLYDRLTERFVRVTADGKSAREAEPPKTGTLASSPKPTDILAQLSSQRSTSAHSPDHIERRWEALRRFYEELDQWCEGRKRRKKETWIAWKWRLLYYPPPPPW